MKLNRKELKKVIYDFNSISSRLLKADYQDHGGILRKFLAFISECEIVRAYIDDCGEPQFDVVTEFNKVANSHGQLGFDLGETSKDEVANVFGILRYVVEQDVNILRIFRSYTHSTKYQDAIKAINERIFFVLIRYIEGHLTKIGIDMGLDESVNYNISVTNGQVNVASDNAVINATINNGINLAELATLINNVRRTIASDLSPEDTESINGSLELLETELKQESPRKSVIRSVFTALQAIKSTTEFSAAVAELIQFASAVL